MKLRKVFCPAICLALSVALGTAAANAQVIYTCDPSVAASTCNYMNTTVAGRYNKTFSNANANIYVTYGVAGLGASTQFNNYITYAQYQAALAAITNPSPVQAAGLLALNNYAAGRYGGGNVVVTSALGTVLGQTGMLGIMSDKATSCAVGSKGCYNAFMTLTNDSSAFFYTDKGGTEASGAYDFYATVEHETDEVLGTASCISTSSSSSIQPTRARLVTKTIKSMLSASMTAANPAKATLADGCGAGVPSAIDLFRYSSAGNLILDSALSTKDGAFFSFDGGITNGANGDKGDGKKFNTKANGADYADFASNADCSINEAVQDAEGCSGQDAGLNILNDGQGEINILNAVGYNLVSGPAPSLAANKPLIHFGQVAYPASATQRGLKLTNNGSTDVVVGAVSIAFTYGNVSQFTFDSSKCIDRDKNTSTLKAGETCHIDLFFNPDAVEVSRATLLISTTPGSTIAIPLTGAGINTLSQ